MSVRIHVETDFGPYQRGTVLVTNVFHAQRVIGEYGAGKTITDNRGRPSAPYAGATLYVRDGWGPRPPPIDDARTHVTFGVSINRYRQGQTYMLSANEIRHMVHRNNDVAVFTMAGVQVPLDHLDRYVRQRMHLQINRLFSVYAAG